MVESQNCKIEITNDDDKEKILKLYRTNNKPIDEDEKKEDILKKFSEFYEIICDPKQFIKPSDLKPGDERELKMSMLYYISKNITKKFGLLIDDMISLIETSPEKNTPGTFMHTINEQLSSFKANKLLQLDVKQLLESVDQIIGYKTQIQTRIDIKEETPDQKEKREKEEEKIKEFFREINRQNIQQNSEPLSHDSEISITDLKNALKKVSKHEKQSVDSDRKSESFSYELNVEKSGDIKENTELKLKKEKALGEKRSEFERKSKELGEIKKKKKLKKNDTLKIRRLEKTTIPELIEEMNKLEKEINELEEKNIETINLSQQNIELLKNFNLDNSSKETPINYFAQFLSDDIINLTKIQKPSKEEQEEQQRKEQEEIKEKASGEIKEKASGEIEKIKELYDGMINGENVITDDLNKFIEDAEAVKIEEKRQGDDSREDEQLTDEEKKEIKKIIISEKKEEEIKKIETKRDQDIESIHSSVSDDRREDDGGRSDVDVHKPGPENENTANAANAGNPVVGDVGNGKPSGDTVAVDGSGGVDGGTDGGTGGGTGGGKFKKLTRKKRKKKTKKTKRKSKKNKKKKKKLSRKTKKKKKSSRKTKQKSNKKKSKKKRPCFPPKGESDVLKYLNSKACIKSQIRDNPWMLEKGSEKMIGKGPLLTEIKRLKKTKKLK